MALLTPDFSEVKDPVGPGVYTCQVTSSELAEWPNGGVYIKWKLETMNETDPKNNGRVIWHKTATSGKGAFMLQKFFQAATKQSLHGEFDTESLYGKQLKVELVDGINRQTGEPTGYTEVKNVMSV